MNKSHKFGIQGKVKKVKGPTQPTLRLLGAEQCRQIALFARERKMILNERNNDCEKERE